MLKLYVKLNQKIIKLEISMLLYRYIKVFELCFILIHDHILSRTCGPCSTLPMGYPDLNTVIKGVFQVQM